MIPPRALPLHQQQQLLDKGSNERWLVLFLGSMLLFGTYYAYDTPATLSVPLTNYLGQTPAEHQAMLALMYSLYSLPNVVLPLLGGYLGDTRGPRQMVFLLAAVVSVGQTVFAVGVNVKSVPLMAVGRLVFGVGAESLGVVQTQLTSVHFRTKELALALGVNLSIARLGSVANDLLTPYVGTKYGTVTAVYTALGFCAMSFLCACALAVTSDPSEINAGGVERGGSGSGGGSGNGSGETMTRWRRIWMTVKGYPKAFWLLAACMCLLYATMIPFNTIHAGFLTEKFYPDDPEKAAQLTSIPDTLSAILTPVSGHLTDRYGLRITALASCGCIIAVVHVYLALIPSSGSPIPALAALGAAYALLLTFWPCVALLVGDEASGFAFGMTTAILNVSLTIVPGVVAILVDQDRTYTVTELAFATCAACAVLVTAVVARSREGQRLEDPPSGSGGGSGEKVRTIAVAGRMAPYVLVSDDADEDGDGRRMREEGRDVEMTVWGSPVREHS